MKPIMLLSIEPKSTQLPEETKVLVINVLRVYIIAECEVIDALLAVAVAQTKVWHGDHVFWQWYGGDWGF